MMRAVSYQRWKPGKQPKSSFLLIGDDVGVFVGQDTLQRHTLDLLVLMAEQLRTKRQEGEIKRKFVSKQNDSTYKVFSQLFH